MTDTVPVFILNNQLPAFEQKVFTTAEICSAAEKTSGFETIEGAQRIGGLWRIYPRNATARQKLLVQGFSLRGVRVEVKDKNPFLVSSPDGAEREVPATKLIINNVPLSFSDDEIFQAVKAMNVNVRSKLIAERDRDKNGKLTRWKTGRRFLYIGVPSEPLPKIVEIGPFKASFYHKEQKTEERQSEAECRKCLQKGHRAAACVNPIKCRQCFKDGHKAGDADCEMTPAASGATVDDHCLTEGSDVNEQNRTSPVRNSKAAQEQPKSRDDSRGRPPRRQKRDGLKEDKRQSKLIFRRDTSRSASQKRPRSVGSTPPQQADKQSRRTGQDKESDRESAAEDEFCDVGG